MRTRATGSSPSTNRGYTAHLRGGRSRCRKTDPQERGRLGDDRDGTGVGDHTPPGRSNVKIRAVNAATAAGNVDVYVTAQGADILAIPPTFAALAPRTASAYLERAAGAIQVRFTTAGTKTVVRDVSLGTLASGAIRTVVLLEQPRAGRRAVPVLTDARTNR